MNREISEMEKTVENAVLECKLQSDKRWNEVDLKIQKMEDEIKYLEGFLISVNKKLSNEKFVANAKPEVVANERKKQADAESKIAALKANIAKLK